MPNAPQSTSESATTAQLPTPELPTRLYPRRYIRQQRGKALGHFVPALVLVTGAMPLLSGRERLTPLFILEFTIGIAYLILMVRELRHLRHAQPHHEQVAWLELAAAGILGLEGYHIWHRHHEAELAGAPHQVHVLPWLYAALAAVYVGLAFGLARLGARRYLHLHAAGYGVRSRLFGPVQEARWSQLTSVEKAAAATVLLHFADGRQQQVSFDHLHDGAAHCTQFVAHAHRHLGQSG